MLRIGVLGAGHLGKIHLKLLREIPEFEVVGFHDPDREVASTVEKEFGIPHFPVADRLIAASDAIDIVTPTLSHFSCAKSAIKQGKHLFIEKPMTNTVDEARELIELVEEARVKAQVGHVERFNPAFLSIQEAIRQPLFIEAHRLAQFNPRGTDVSVIFDLMVHDIDLVLSQVKAHVRNISASGVAIVSNSPDIANARIEFDNGCVANLTASRISVKQMRKMRFFQKNAYIAVDFLERKSEIFQLYDEQNEERTRILIEGGKVYRDRFLDYSSPEIPRINAIQEELKCFAQAILEDSDPPVTVLDGFQAIQIATQIQEKVEKGVIVR